MLGSGLWLCWTNKEVNSLVPEVVVLLLLREHSPLKKKKKFLQVVLNNDVKVCPVCVVNVVKLLFLFMDQH